MYHAGPIALTILVIYLFTLFLTFSGFLTVQVHRRFWNWILFGASLVTMLFGLFMALKITYRWNVPFSAELLHWHVEIGILMACSAIIHITWHYKYYFSKAGRPVKEKENDSSMDDNRKTASVAAGPLLLLTGFTSSSSQFILLREAVIMGGGTEVITGLFLWLWLIISAAGAVAGARSERRQLSRMIWALISGMAVAPVAFIFMNSLLLHPGETPSLFKIIAIIAVTVAPVTFIASFLFIQLTAESRRSSRFSPGRSFGLETAGSVAAGILTSVTVTLQISNYQLYILILISSVTFAVLLLPSGLTTRRAALFSALPLAILVLIFSPDIAVRNILIKGVKAERSVDTPYGNITTGNYGGEKTIFYDHRPLFYSGDIARCEENIHYALLQRDTYKKVMIISGGIMRHLEQLQKYDITEVLYLEHDPGIIAAEGAHDTIVGKMTVSVIKNDPIQYLRRSNNTFDAVLQLIPPPTTLSVNRFYTVEYFRMVKDHLSPGGIFLCTPMPWYSYTTVSYRRSLSPIFNALSEVYSHVVIIPGSSLYVIASDQPLTDSVSLLAERRSLDNTYVNGDYLDDNDIRYKSEQIISQVDTNAGVNSAERPVSSWFSNILSLESKGLRGSAAGLLLLLLIIPFIFIRRGGIMMFTSSASFAGYGMMMIFILQITVGNIYILTALILSLMMGGLALGASNSIKTYRRPLIIIPVLLALLFFLTGLMIPALTSASGWIVILLTIIALFAAGYLTGSIYKVLTTSGGEGTYGTVYAADLAGAALGFVTVSTLLVPLMGPVMVSFLLGGMILIASALVSVLFKH